MEEVKTDGPSPLENTIPHPAQKEFFLFSYVLLAKPYQGIVGKFKFISSWATMEEIKLEFKRVYDTNKNCTLGWGKTGEWEILRTPETDIGGEVEVIPLDGKMFGEDDDFYGEKLSEAEIPVRQLLKDPKANETINDRMSIDHFKSEKRAMAVLKKKNELHQIAMEELQKETDDTSTLASYSQMQYKRLAQKSRIEDLQEQLVLAQKELQKTVVELRDRTRRFPHYRNQWHGKLNDMKSIMSNGRHKGDVLENVDISDDNDQEYIDMKFDKVKDEFEREGGIEAPREKYEETDNFSKEALEERNKEYIRQLDEQRRELIESKAKLDAVQENVARGFMPDDPTKKIANKNRKKKDKDKKKKKKDKDKKNK